MHQAGDSEPQAVAQRRSPVESFFTTPPQFDKFQGEVLRVGAAKVRSPGPSSGPGDQSDSGGGAAGVRRTGSAASSELAPIHLSLLRYPASRNGILASRAGAGVARHLFQQREPPGRCQHSSQPGSPSSSGPHTFHRLLPRTAPAPPRRSPRSRRRRTPGRLRAGPR